MTEETTNLWGDEALWACLEKKTGLFNEHL